MTKEAWKKRATEVERLLHKVTKENKKLRQQLADERASKSRKSRNLKRAVKSLLEAGLRHLGGMRGEMMTYEAAKEKIKNDRDAIERRI